MPSSEQWRLAKERSIAGSLAFVAGYTDVIMVTRWTVQTATMTSNMLLLSRSGVNAQSELLTGRPSQDFYQPAWFYLLLIFLFACGVASWRVAEHFYKDRGASTLAIPYASLMLGMELLLRQSVMSEYSLSFTLTVLAYAPMFGMLNAACGSGRIGASTCACTGHFVQVTKALAKRFLLRLELSQAEGGKMAMGMIVIGSLLSGAAVGMGVHEYFPAGGACGALLPVGPALALLLFLHDHCARPSSVVKKMNKLRRSSSLGVVMAGLRRVGSGVRGQPSEMTASSSLTNSEACEEYVDEADYDEDEDEDEDLDEEEDDAERSPGEGRSPAASAELTQAAAAATLLSSSARSQSFSGKRVMALP